MKSYYSKAANSLGLPLNSYVYNITSTSAQDDVRSLSIPSLASTDRIVAISSDDSISTLDASTLKSISAITKSHDSITSIKRYATPGQQCTTFVTAGRDGFVRGWDLRSNHKALEFSAPSHERLSAIECSAELQAVFAGTELEGDGPGQVNVFGWDVRMPGAEVKINYAESHSDTVTELRLLPAVGETNTSLLSAATDGLVNVFNTAISDEDDALSQVIRSSSALQHAGLIGGDIFALGTDETLAFYALQNPNPDVKDPDPCIIGDVRERFGCEYVVNMFDAGSKPYLAIGSHSEGWLDLIRFKNKAASAIETRMWKPKKAPDTKIRLVGGHGEELVRDVIVPEGAEVIYTCGEDGMVRAWAGGDADDDVEMGGTSSKTSKKRKNKNPKT